MSDGSSIANREGKALRDIEHGLELLARGMSEVHDAAFGLPEEVLAEVDAALVQYGVGSLRALRAALDEAWDHHTSGLCLSGEAAKGRRDVWDHDRAAEIVRVAMGWPKENKK